MAGRYEVTEHGSGYIFTFPDQHLSFRLDRLRENTQHEVTAEVLVASSNPGIVQHLHHARLNLTSSQAKDTLGKILEKRLPDMFDWDGMVHIVTLTTLERFRHGEPAVKFKDMLPPERLEYKIRPLLVEKEVNLLYGRGGSGKTYLGLYLACLCSIPIADSWLGDVEPSVVLYLDYEASAEVMWRRVQRLYAGLGYEASWGSEIVYRYCHQPLADEVEEIQRLMGEHEIDLVVVDSLGLACGGEPEQAAVALQVYRALRSLKTTTLLIHHENKAGKAFGSVYIENMARNVWEIVRAQEEGRNQIDVGLYHRKANDGALLKPWGASIVFEGEMVVVKRQDIRAVPELSGRLQLHEQLAFLLRRGSSTVRELAEELEKPEGTVRVTLNRHKEKFVHLGEEQWGLVTQSTSVTPA